MTAQRSATPQPLRRPPLLALLTLLLLALAAFPAFAITSVRIVNPQAADHISASLTPDTYLVNGTAFDADTVKITIVVNATTTVNAVSVPVKRGAWEYLWTVTGADTDGASITVVGVKKGQAQTNTTASAAVSVVIDKPTPSALPTGGLTLIPGSVDTALYLNLTTLSQPVSVLYRAIPATGNTLTTLNYGEVLATLTASAFDATLNNDAVSPNLHASYTFSPATGQPRRTLYATFTDSGALTSRSFSRSILVDDVAPTISLTSAANFSMTTGGGVPTTSYVLTGTAQDTDAIVPRNNEISGIGDIKVIAHRVRNSDGTATLATDPTTYLVIPALIIYGPEAVAPPMDGPLVSDPVTWQAVLPDTAFKGTYDFDIVATDNAGNRTTITSSSQNVNTTGPTATLNIIKTTGGVNVTGGVAKVVTGFNITASATNGSIASYQIFDTFQGVSVSATGPVTPAPGTTTLTATDVVTSNAYNTSSVGDGLHVFTLVVADTVGNTTTSAPKFVTIDNTAPVVTITSPQSGTTVAAGTPLVGAISDANPSHTASDVHFDYSYNAGANTGTITTTLDATGRTATAAIPASLIGQVVTLTLTATDLAGNTTTSPQINVIVTSPTTGLSEVDALIQNPADGSPVTRRNTLPAAQTYVRGVFQVYGTVGGFVGGVALKSWRLNLVSVADLANPAAVPVLTVGSGTTAQNAALLGSANSASVPDSAYYLRLDLTDVNNTVTTGTVGGGTAAAVTVDNTAPAITSADVNGVNGLFFNNTTSPKTLAGTYTDANSGSAYLLVDNALYPNSAGTAGGSVAQSTTGIAEGAHTFNVVAVDLAGNRTTSSPAKTFTIDNTSPVVSVICPQDGATVAAGTPLIGVISDINPSHNASDVHFNYAFGATTGTIAVTLDATGRTASAVVPALFAGHSVAISLTAADLAGNTATSTAIEITVPGAVNALNHVDTTVLNPQDGAALPRQNNLPAAQTYIRRNFSVFGTISPNNLQNWTVNLVRVVDLANAAAVPVLTVGSGTSPQNAALLGSADSTTITDGAYYLRLDVTNAGVTTIGTVGGGTAAAVTVDNTAPTITNADVNSVNGLFFNNTPPKTLAGSYTDANPGSAYLLVDNALFPNSAGTAGTGVSQSTATIAEGVHAFSVVAVDLAGNRTASSPADTFTIDNTNPVVVILSPQSGTTVAVGSQIIGSITDVNPSPNVANVYFSYNGVRDTNPVTLDPSSHTVTSVIPLFAAGAVTVTLTAADKAGNTGVSAPISLTVTNLASALVDVDALIQNALDGSPVTRHIALPAAQTYVRGAFQAYGTVTSIVNGAALKNWTVVLYDTTTNTVARTVGTGTSAQKKRPAWRGGHDRPERNGRLPAAS